jgi:phosphoglycerate dehydrogenase-like enzyme
MKLLVTGVYPYRDQDFQKMKDMGYDVVYMEKEDGFVPESPRFIEGIICNNLFAHHKLDDFPNLKYIQVTSAGLDHMPVREINYQEIELRNAKGVFSAPMAEWVVLKILEIAKKSKHFYQAQADKCWQKNADLIELDGLTASILGFGHVGREVAKRLMPFGVKIIAVNTKCKAQMEADECYGICDLHNVLPKSDIVISALPLKEETRHIIGEQEINEMKDGSIFINVSRGAVVDEKALIKAIEKGKFKGVALDVFEEEPLDPESPLWTMENVIVTPHNAYASNGIKQRLIAVILSNLQDYIK